MSRFHSLKIKKLKKETPECVSVSFDIPEEKKELFRFRQGQYLTLRKDIEGEDVRRSYSICTSPLEDQLAVAIKAIPDGKFSNYANFKLQEGDVLEVMPPLGNFFTELHPENKKKYFFIAVGSGVTPIISNVKTILETEPLSSVIVLYGNKNKGSIIFKEQFEALKNKYMNRVSVHYILSKEKTDAEILTGRIDSEKINYFLDHVIDIKEINESFLCGPEELVLTAKQILTEAGLEAGKIHFELFNSTKGKQQARQFRTENSSGLKSKVSIKLDGTTMDIDVDYAGETILDAALQHNSDLPFACKGGVCCACRAKLEKGEVTMDVNYGLEPDEIEAGFILTCQAHPTTSEVVVNFDVK